MKIARLTLAFIMVIVFSGIITQSTQASTSYLTTYVTSVTYENVGSSTTTSLIFNFYNGQDGNNIFAYQPGQLGSNTSGSLYIGSLNLTVGGFNGGMKVTSDQPILLTLVQIPTGQSDVVVRPVSNGFTSGGNTAYVASVLKNSPATGPVNTVLSVQNVGTVQTTATLNLYNANTGQFTKYWTEVLQPGGAYFFDAGSNPNLYYDFPTYNGSMVITSNNSPIAVTAMEKDISGAGAKAFEGFVSGATKMYMPSALCNSSGATSFYAVQNIGSIQTLATVSYSNTSATQSATINPGAKASFDTCFPGIPSPYIGAATITSSTTAIIAIGKIVGNGLTTAYNGFSQGYPKLALPFVRWASNAHWNTDYGYQRVFIAIQNVSQSQQPAGVQVQYIDNNNNTWTKTLGAIDPGGKVNSSFGDFNLDQDFGYPTGGGVFIKCTGTPCQLAAIARVDSPVSGGGIVGEDYNAMPVN